MIIVFAICTVIVSVFGFVFHIYMNRRQNQAYSLNSDINNIVNLTMKKYIASAMLIMSLLNFVAWITFVLMCIIQDTVGNLSFWMYIILQLLSGCTLTVILILARNRKNEMLKADTQPVFVDDDDYWKTGFSISIALESSDKITFCGTAIGLEKMVVWKLIHKLKFYDVVNVNTACVTA